MGRTYSIRGRVVFGSQNGRIIGFPTANIDYRNYFVPGNGVYYVNVKIDGVVYLGMCNVGHNPTFNFSNKIKMEVNIFGLDEDIYDSVIEIFFVERIREEIQFNSKEELIKQLKNDKAICLELAGNANYTK